MEPVNNAHNPWLEPLEDAQLGTAAKVTGMALSVMAMALFGPVILIYKACIRLQRNAPEIESIDIEIDDDESVSAAWGGDRWGADPGRSDRWGNW
jgi:hypothetical protein